MRRVLIVDDNRECVELITNGLSKDEYSIQNALNSEAAIHRLKAWKPHLVILGLNSQKLTGIELITKIRGTLTDEYIAILVMTEHPPLEDILTLLNTGADDCLFKPFQTQEVIARVRGALNLKELHDSLKRANHRIDELSSTDELTSLLNMRAVFRRGEEEIIRSRRYKRPISLLLLNLDGFSGVNQTYGFMTGSHVLQEVATRIKQCVRSIDLVARVGADEFFVFLLETDLAGAEFMAERIRDSVQSTPFKNEKQSIRLTMSVGVAGLMPDQTTQKMGDLLHLASEALRLAKANGNNRTEVFSFA